MFLFQLQVGVLCPRADIRAALIAQFPRSVDPCELREWSDLARRESFPLDLVVCFSDDASDPLLLHASVPVLPVDETCLRLGPDEWESLLYSQLGVKATPHPLQRLIGLSRPIFEFKKKLLKASGSAHPLLLTGENGTGKDLAANLAHELSDRRNGPFVAVNCASIPIHLAEALLFGSIKGSFTDAETRQGHCQAARGGSLFLDEIGELPPEVQATLLRVLENKEIRRVGSDKTEIADFRLICATNRNLGQRVRDGLFRQDLYYRINVLVLRMPALRERREDIPLLAHHFSRRKLSPGAMEKLCNHDWPGNLRELRNVMVRAEVLHDSARVEAHHLDLAEEPA
jgi:two-component system response regulator GlrR